MVAYEAIRVMYTLKQVPNIVFANHLDKLHTNLYISEELDSCIGQKIITWTLYSGMRELPISPLPPMPPALQNKK